MRAVRWFPCVSVCCCGLSPRPRFWDFFLNPPHSTGGGKTRVECPHSRFTPPATHTHIHNVLLSTLTWPLASEWHYRVETDEDLGVERYLKPSRSTLLRKNWARREGGLWKGSGVWVQRGHSDLKLASFLTCVLKQSDVVFYTTIDRQDSRLHLDLICAICARASAHSVQSEQHSVPQRINIHYLRIHLIKHVINLPLLVVK